MVRNWLRDLAVAVTCLALVTGPAIGSGYATSGVSLGAANVWTAAQTFATDGVGITDSDASHVLTLSAGNQNATRTLSAPNFLGAGDEITTCNTAQNFFGAKYFRANTLYVSDTSSTNTALLTFPNLASSGGSLTTPSTGSDTYITTGVSAGTQRERFQFNINSNGTLADGTTYSFYIVPGRAGTVTNVAVVAGTAPVGGTNTIDVKKGGSGGTSVLSATFDPTTLTANTIGTGTLSGTLATKQFTATQGLYISWATGTQTTDAVAATVCVEVEFNAL